MGDLARRPHRLGAAKYQLPAPEKLDGPEVLVDLGGDRCGDTTVVKANVEYPTDPGLLAKDVVKMAEKIKRIKGGVGCPHLLRTRRLQPQPGQDRRAHHLNTGDRTRTRPRSYPIDAE